MTKITSSQAVAAALLACGLSAIPAQAGPNRTWVSGLGTDSGACTRTAPCRTFAFAIGQTAAGGEIDVLDPAGYGPVTIAKAISIVNDGVGTAGITATSGNAITINTGATDSVHLRGLTLTGLSSRFNGIQFGNSGNFEIENCVIRDFDIGINIAPFALADAKGMLSNVITNDNGTGIFLDGSVTGASLNVTVADSVSSNNNVGVRLFSGTKTTVMVRNSTVVNNNSGVVTNDGALYLARSTVTGNKIRGVLASGGTIFSYGDNDINGNVDDGVGSLTAVAAH
ncbi:MAG TPA: right-handed parallel beta-helix repeat-containing protein [Methylocella sp.]|nr:right-handed parallel beta-helix repeat-containing protein [Methylocella sp.]